MITFYYLIFFTIFSLSDADFGNKNFNNINKMIVLVVQGGQTYTNDHYTEYVDPKVDQAMVYAYYPPGDAPIGTYNIYLKYHNLDRNTTAQYLIGTINYEGDARKWIINNNNRFFALYTDGRQNLPSFKIETQYDTSVKHDENVTPKRAEEYANKFRFVVYFKNRDENFYLENVEDPNLYDNVTDEFCTNYVHATGSQRKMGSLCPFDPIQNKRMDMCLNWRRADIIGKKCRSQLLNKKEIRDNSAVDFCNTNIGADDCRCINRNTFLKFSDNRDVDGYGHPYCSNKVCNSGDYLIKPESEIIKCETCVVKLDIKSEKAILRNNYIFCKDHVQSIDNDDKKKLLLTLIQKIYHHRKLFTFLFT